MFRQFWDDEKIFKMFLSISPLYVHFNPSENASPISLPNGFDDGQKWRVNCFKIFQIRKRWWNIRSNLAYFFLFKIFKILLAIKKNDPNSIFSIF